MAKGKKNKNERHSALLKDYSKAKQDHLEKLTDKLLKEDEKNQKLRDKNINTDFLDLF
jgi:hypothetical protein